MLTRKHFEAIAATLKQARADADEGNRFTVDDVSIALAGVLKAENPRFDEERFLEACDAHSLKA